MFLGVDDKLTRRALKSLERNRENFLDKILDSVKLHETNEFYDFGEFRLDARKRRLWRGGEVVALTPKEFEVLFFLVMRAGQVVEKEELLDAVWTDVYVEETTLARNVSWLRQKLGTANGGAKIIETVPKRGYRFLPEVTRSENAPALRVEEKILQRVVIKETITFDESESIAASNEPNLTESNLPTPKLLNPKSEIQKPKWFWLSLVFAFVALAAIGFAAYQNFSRRSEPKVIVAAPAAPFSGLAGSENFPAFSPDGKLLTYVWNGGAGENFDVYVKQIGAGEPVRLTDTKEDEVHPVFSPDGAHIAFVRTFPDHSEVFLIPTLGGAERKICNLQRTYSRLSFSPDGKTLAATEVANEREGIFLIEVQTGAKKRKTLPPDSTSDIAARFSPDGKTLAFLRRYGATDAVFVVSATDTNASERQLTFDKTGIVGLAWNADGKRIIFASGMTALTSNLRRISIDGSESELIAVNGKNITNPIVSADGKTLAFVEESYQTSIWQLENKLPPHRLIESSRDDHSPNYSPDDARIAFVSNRTGNQEIWIADANGKNQRQLTDSTQFAGKSQSSTNASPNTLGSPRFSPDGNFVAYDAQINGNSDIFIVSADGGASRRLTSDSSQEILPAWSADGQSIYFNSNRGGDSNLWKIPLAGGEPVQITKQGAFESFAASDGKTIFYTKSRGEKGLWRVSADGGGEEISVAELSEAGNWRYWTMTKRGIYFVAPSELPPYKIKFYDFSNSQISQIVTTEKSPIWTYPGLSASAKGKTVLYTQSDQNASSIMLAKLPEESD